MKNSRIKSVMKNLSLAAIGALVLLGFVFVPKMTVKAATFDYDSNYKSLTISGTIDNDTVDFTGMVIADTSIPKAEIKHIYANNVILPPNSAYLFSCFTNVESIDFTNANTASVTNMKYMFYDCTKLNGVSLNGFNTSKVTDMTAMFENCSSLTSLDLSSFTVSQLRDVPPTSGPIEESMQNMFHNCRNLEYIIVNNDWALDSSIIGSDMFTGCTKLVGGNGTIYINTTDGHSAKYAKIDSETTTGYLSHSDSIIVTGKMKTDGNRFRLEVFFSQKVTGLHDYVATYGGTEVYSGQLKYDTDVASFEINEVAKKLNDEKALVITKDGIEIYNHNISIADYLRRICNIYSFDSPEYNLAGSILRYAASAQKYFNNHPEKPANKDIAYYTDYTTRINPFPENYDSEFNATVMNKAFSDAEYKDATAVTYSQMNLSFDENLTFMMAFKVPDGESATYLADTTLANLIKEKHKQSADNYSLESGGPNYIVTMTKNINVKNLDAAVFGADEFGQDVTPVLYLYRVYKASSNQDMKNLAISLYDFHVRAKAYQN